MSREPPYEARKAQFQDVHVHSLPRGSAPQARTRYPGPSYVRLVESMC